MQNPSCSTWVCCQWRGRQRPRQPGPGYATGTVLNCGPLAFLAQLASRQAAAGRPQLVEALQRSPLADLRSVLQNIFLFRIHNHVEQVGLCNMCGLQRKAVLARKARYGMMARAYDTAST